jgi:hypothetical protein
MQVETSVRLFAWAMHLSNPLVRRWTEIHPASLCESSIAGVTCSNRCSVHPDM